MLSMTKDHDFITINDTKYNLQGIESLVWKKLVNGSVKKKMVLEPCV
jgi:hypothetical protein